ncbi:MAG: HepT-like ribonuclease domain-containing protein [Patescibacteria group bacterium]
MSLTLDKNLITKKLALLDGFITELSPIVALSEQEILNDTLKFHTAERLFQLIADEMIDINTHLIRVKDLAPPDDLQSTFTVLGEAGVLPIDFTVKISPVVGLRNAIVHRYECVDLKLFIHLLKLNFDDFKRFSIFIADQFLKS